ncbi:NifU family protein [Crocinitomicaceae bacterium]|jgi:Fe-S cluster biogenesis protein NfuA|nr:NifU family protein [Crocinitomicaceae bacterium]MDG1346640.1 NifU family protein [Crocinitomicaceae bacterium]MDG2464148.1 NifU family protein [Crocinitomicaceae bacterium]
MSFNKLELTNRINDVLASLRPFFEADGGDMKLVDITDKGVAQIQLLGACSDCSMSQMTLKAGVEEALKKAAPEIIGVEAVILEA